MRGERVRWAWAVVVAVALALGCGESAPPLYDATPYNPVVAVDVTPRSANLMPGARQTFTAQLRLANGSVRAPQNGEVTWTSRVPQVATIDATGVATAGSVAGGTTIIATVSMGSTTVSGAAALTVTLPHALDAIQITPATATINCGQIQSYTAIGHFLDGTTEDITTQVQWTSSMPARATIDTAGTARGVSEGMTTIRASMGAVMSNGATLTMGCGPRLISISLNPGALFLLAGSTMPTPIRATANYADGTNRDITEQTGIVWTSSAPTIATVSNAPGTRGQVLPSATMTGAANITATLDGVTSSPTVVTSGGGVFISSIAVTPSPLTLSVGEMRPLMATATFNDGRSADYTATVTWSSSAPAVASIGATTGSALGVAIGTATLSATLGTVSGSTTVTVTGNVLVAIEVAPASATLAVGGRQAYTAIGTYLDGTARPLTAGVAWSTDRPSVATVDAAGVLTAYTAGVATVRAQVGSVSGAAVVTVTASAPVAVRVTPSDVTLAVDGRQQLRAVATFRDGTAQDVTSWATWVSATRAVATVSTEGLVTGVALGGPVAVTATLPVAGGTPVTGTAGVTVSAATVTAVELVPAPFLALPRGVSRVFAATGVFSDGSRRDLSLDPNLAWRTLDPTIATIDNAAGRRGVATAVAPGTTEIGASYNDGVHPAVGSALTALMVSPALLTRIDVSAPYPNAGLGLHLRFTATGVYADGATADLTGDPTLAWSSTNPSVATVSNAAGPGRGVAQCAAPGTTTVRATVGALVGDGVLQCNTGARPATLTLAPATADLAIGAPGQRFTVSAVFVDGSTRDLTDEPALVYATSDPLRVAFDRAVAAALPGATPATGITLTVSYGPVVGTATANVTPAPTP